MSTRFKDDSITCRECGQIHGRIVPLSLIEVPPVALVAYDRDVIGPHADELRSLCGPRFKRLYTQDLWVFFGLAVTDDAFYEFVYEPDTESWRKIKR